ncbi:DUF1684 domain-containing protein [Actinoplanes rectilineatus]|uniref:DUF1684 domain-containing protein n=1 Tax=Actinoplanes rectilineatus TaxID=113571 RepID=UPI0005F2C6E7|nr:DUF1684 domain-containing protein [Actinoplanes rectilineatus]
MTITFQQEWETWHDAHEQRRASPHGFLAITGLHWLTETPQRFDGVPGSWSTGPSGPAVTLDDGEEIIVDGSPVSGSFAFGKIPDKGDVTVEYGNIRIEVASRGGFDVVRPRDPAGPVLKAYDGTPAYPADEKWVISGDFRAFDEPRPYPVGSVAEGIEHVYESPGVISFAVDGVTHELIAFNGNTPGSLSVLFTDETSGVTTYAANRSVQVPAPAADGTVTVDFNRATNLPCAYTEFATCPLPPQGNRLPIAVEAGEKKPG